MKIFRVVSDQKINNKIEIRKFQPAIEICKNDHAISSQRGIGALSIASRSNSAVSVKGMSDPEQLLGPDQKSNSMPT